MTLTNRMLALTNPRRTGRLLGLLACLLLTALAGCAGEQTVALAQTPAVPRSGSTAAAQAGLTPIQAEQLAALGVPVAVPTYVPEGFAVDAVGTHPGVAGLPLRSPSYTLRYAAPSGACFVIETTTGGLGGPAAPRTRRPVDPPLFPAPPSQGYHVFWTGADPERPFPPHSLFSSWLERERRFYRLTSGRTAGEDCRRVAPPTAVRIVESLQWLNGPAASTGRADSFEMAAYDVYLLNRPFAITSETGASPRAAALHVLDELGIGPGDAAETAVRVTRRPPDTAAVLVTVLGLRDDSVAGRRRIVKMYRREGRWVLDLVGTQYKCQSGRGHRNWSKEHCL